MTYTYDFHVNCIQRSVPTSHRTQPVSTVKTSMKEVQGEKKCNTLCGRNAELLQVTSGGTYSYHWNLNGGSIPTG